MIEGSNLSGWKQTGRCLRGTRRRYIESILQWCTDLNAEPVCWLTGVAGSGKSSIAHEIAAHHHEDNRMYTCFFFQRDDPSISSSAVQLLAYGLCHYSTTLRSLITQAMESLQDIRITPTLLEQFKQFIVEPLC